MQQRARTQALGVSDVQLTSATCSTSYCWDRKLDLKFRHRRTNNININNVLQLNFSPGTGKTKTKTKTCSHSSFGQKFTCCCMIFTCCCMIFTCCCMIWHDVVPCSVLVALALHEGLFRQWAMIRAASASTSMFLDEVLLSSHKKKHSGLRSALFNTRNTGPTLPWSRANYPKNGCTLQKKKKTRPQRESQRRWISVHLTFLSTIRRHQDGYQYTLLFLSTVRTHDRAVFS